VSELEDCLEDVFEYTCADRIYRAYERAQQCFRTGDFGSVLVQGGLFIESILRGLRYRIDGKLCDEVNVSAEIARFRKLPRGKYHEALKSIVSSACEFLYAIRTHHGAAHDRIGDEPTELDAAVVLIGMRVLLVEVVRHISPDARQAVRTLEHEPLKQIDGKPSAASVSLEKIAQILRPSSQLESVLVVAYCLSSMLQSGFTIDQIRLGLERAALPMPKNLADVITRAIRRAWLADSGRKLGNKRLVYLTATGRELVERKLRKAIHPEPEVHIQRLPADDGHDAKAV